MGGCVGVYECSFCMMLSGAPASCLSTFYHQLGWPDLNSSEKDLSVGHQYIKAVFNN